MSSAGRGLRATAATKVTLACGHLIAAWIIIPVVARRLAAR
jgi:hypothetical protein